MKYRFLYMVSVLLISQPSFSQDISRQDADSIIKALKNGDQSINHIALLLNLAQFHIFKPGELQVDFDSAMVYINKAKELNKSLKSPNAAGYQLLTESFIAKEKGQPVEGKKMVEKAITILQSGTNKSYLGMAIFELSNYFDYNDPQQLSKKIDLVNQSVDIFQQAGDIAKKARSLEMLGDLYNVTEEFDKSIPVLKRALAAYDTIKYKKLQGIYVLLGAAYLYQSNHSQALYYMLRALKTAREVQDSSMQLCQINNYLGIVYQEIDRKDMSIKYLNDALAIAKKYNDESAIYLLVTSMSVTYNDLDQPQRALEVLASIPEKLLASDFYQHRLIIKRTYLRTYLGLNQYSKAQPYCDTLLKIAKENPVTDQFRNNIYRVAATYYLYTKQYSKARYYLTQNIKIAKSIHYEMGTILDSRLWYKMDSAQGNFQSAYNHLLFYKTKMDSLFSESKVRQFEVLGVEYEIGMKEDSIKLRDKDILLLKETNSFQQANLKQASIIKNITIAGIILALIIIGLLYRQYKQKQKSNRAITQKNEQLQHFLTEKEWLLKEIHHRVKNNLQIVMSLLNSQSAYIENDAALTAIHDSQHRVHAMSLIHQKLYNTENVSSIDMSSYIRELSTYLADSFNMGRRIRFEYNVAALQMDVSQAIPLGLILNEAITNAIKYAFPGDREGIINILLSNSNDNDYLLCIKDNGIGIPGSITNKKPGSLGMSLMAGLSKELEGNFVIENNNGTLISISFKNNTRIKRPGLKMPGRVTSN